MPKEQEGHHCCCCGGGKFWWGLICGVVIAVIFHIAICMHCCRGGMGPCPMMKPPAQAQAQK